MILVGSVLLSEIVGVPIGAAASEYYGPWISFVAGPIILGSGIGLIAFLPETIGVHRSQGVDTSDGGSLHALAKRIQSVHLSTLPRKFYQMLASLPLQLWRNLTLVALVVVYYVSILGRQTAGFLVLYASERFLWSKARVSPLPLALRSIHSLPHRQATSSRCAAQPTWLSSY